MTQPDLPDWVRNTAIIDAPRLIEFSGFNQALPHAGGVLDVSTYQSIILRANSVNPAIHTPIHVKIAWSIAGTPVAEDHLTIWGSSVANIVTPPTIVVLPCRGAQAQVSMDDAGAGNLVSWNVFGSKRVVPGAVIFCDALASAPALLSVQGVAVGAGATVSYYIGPTHGPIGYSVTLSGTNNTLIVFAQTFVNGAVVSSRVISKTFTNNVTDTNIYAPGLALLVQVTNTTAVAANLSALILPERM